MYMSVCVWPLKQNNALEEGGKFSVRKREEGSLLREREREKVRTRSESLSPFERMIEKEEGEKMCHILSAKHL